MNARAPLRQYALATLLVLALGMTGARERSEGPAELPYGVIEISFTSDDATLAGTLTLPHGDGPHPGLVLVSGSGAHDRDGMHHGMPGYTPLRWLADHLTRHGFAVLRFDERGIAASTGDHEVATTNDLANDVAAGVIFLADQDRLDPERVGVLGHSEGAMIAASVAASLPEVAFVVSMAGPGVPSVELLAVQVQRIAETSGMSESEVADAVERQRQLSRLVQAREWEALEAYLWEAGTEQIDRLSPLQRGQLGDVDKLLELQVSVTMAELQTPWMMHFLDTDPRDDWRRVTVPVLALFAELDVQVDLDQNRGPLEMALAEAGNDDVTVVVFPRANHLFQEAVTGNVDEYSALPMAFVPGFLDVISDWLSERFLP